MYTKSNHYNLKPGDHVLYKMDIPGTHHGIFIGNNSFIHYDGKKGQVKNTVIQVTASKFLGEDFERRLSVRRYKLSSVNLSSPDETIKRAESRLGEKAYNLITSNCEHFCTWCCISHSYSAQIADKLEVGYEGVDKVLITVETMGTVTEVLVRSGALIASVGLGAASLLNLVSLVTGRGIIFPSLPRNAAYYASKFFNYNRPEKIKEVITRKRVLTLDDTNFMMERSIMRDSFEDVYVGIAKDLLSR